MSQSSIWPSGWTQAHLAALARCDAASCVCAWPDLVGALDQYLSHLRRAVTHNEFIDVQLGELLVESLRVVIGRATLNDGCERGWIRMSAVYLLNTDDTKNDLTAIDGLDDDAEIILALLDALNRPDLAHPIRAHIRR